jgi:hypothetical protein
MALLLALVVVVPLLEEVPLAVMVPLSGGGGPPGGDGGRGAPAGPLPSTTAAQFLAMWDKTPMDVGRQNLEQTAIACGTPEV